MKQKVVSGKGNCLKHSQKLANYNVFCSSCGQILGLNLDSRQEAEKRQEDHLQDSACVTVLIRKIDSQSGELQELDA